MKKPEKMKILDLDTDITDINAYVRHKLRVTGYNQACDEWEAYHDGFIATLDHAVDNLPSEEEIEKFIIKFIAGKDCPYTYFRSRIVGVDELKELAKTIHKRIGGE